MKSTTLEKGISKQTKTMNKTDFGTHTHTHKRETPLRALFIIQNIQFAHGNIFQCIHKFSGLCLITYAFLPGKHSLTSVQKMEYLALTPFCFDLMCSCVFLTFVFVWFGFFHQLLFAWYWSKAFIDSISVLGLRACNVNQQPDISDIKVKRKKLHRNKSQHSEWQV